MGRGGKREGAGRPRLHTELERIGIGAAAQQEWRNQSQKEAEDRFEHLRLFKRLSAEEADASKAGKKLSPKDRNRIIGKRRRYYKFNLKRPYALKKKILQEVAERYGVKPSYVDDCWKDYRDHLRNIKD